MPAKDKYERWESEIVYQLNKRDVMSILVAIPELFQWRLKDIEDFCDREILPLLDLDYNRDIRLLVENRLAINGFWDEIDIKYAEKVDK